MTNSGIGGQHHSLNSLLLQVAAGDQAAYAQLYDAVAPVVFGITRRVLRDSSQSEEVTQEAMLEVWRRAARFDPRRGDATAWVATIAHRRAVDRVRSSESSRARDQKAGRWEIAYDPVSEHVLDRAEREMLAHAMSQLTSLQREVIELAYYGGRTYREVATHLDAPLGTVKTRMRDGLLRLRQALTSSDGEAPSAGVQA